MSEPTTQAELEAMLDKSADECVEKILKLRDELTLQYDSRIVHAGMIAAAARIATGLRAAGVYDTAMLVRLHCETLIEELTTKVEAKVVYTSGNQPMGSKQ